MRVGSLFTGVGGFDLGLERAGHEVVWQVENDKQCRAVLKRHWPGVPIYEDVHDVGGSERDGTGLLATVDNGITRRGREPTESAIDRDLPSGGQGDTQRTTLAPVDLICGGFPCQDVSVAGRRAGLAGERSGLWWEFHRIIGELDPAWVLIENVPGLLSSNEGRDMAVLVRGLEELGYGWSYRILDSQYFRVAQRRRRVFIVGRAGGFCPPEILLEPESVFGDSAPSREAGAGVTPGVGYSPKASGGNQQDDHETCVAHTLRAEGFDASEDGTGRGTPIVAFNWQSGGDVRLDPTEEHRSVPRRLTPTECERLQGFPDDWTEGHADGPRYRMMGNAVTVSVAEWIGRRFPQNGVI